METANILTVTAALNLFLADRRQYCRETTLKSYYGHLKPMAQWAGERPLCADLVREYLFDLKERGRTEETIRNVYRITKTMCRWLYEEELIDRDPFTGRGRVKVAPRSRHRRPTYSDLDIVRLLAAKPTGWKKERVTTRQQWQADGVLARAHIEGKALILLLCDSALRAAEICALNCGDVRANELLVHSKGGDIDRAYISDTTRSMLLEVVSDRDDTAPLFRNWDNERCQARWAGVKMPARPLHAFRHWAARKWLAAGLSDLTIQKLMRHRQVTTTQIYIGDGDTESIARQHAQASPIAVLLLQAEAAKEAVKTQ